MRHSLGSRVLYFFASLFALVALAPLAVAQPSFGTNAEFKGVPTFESLGLYWSPPGKGANVAAHVQYKPAGAPESEFKDGLDLWFDDRTAAPPGGTAGEYRGSLVLLQPGTGYDVRLTLSSGLVRLFSSTSCPDPTASCTRTWSESFPESNVVVLPAAPVTHVVITPKDVAAPQTSLSAGVFTINVPVNPTSGYTVITHAPGGNKVVNSAGAPDVVPANGDTSAWGTQVDSCVLVEPGAHHFIIRDLELRNCKRHGIFLQRECALTGPSGTCQQTHNAYSAANGGALPQTRDIVIEDNTITRWGAFGTQLAGFPNDDGAVACNYDSNVGVKPARVVIQRNRMFDPTFSATSWTEHPNYPTTAEHPHGPLGVEFFSCGKNHVVRHNDVTGVNADAPYSSPVSISVGSPAVVTWNNHGLAQDTPVMFTTTGQLPAGLKPNTVYFVKSPTANSFQLSARFILTTRIATSGTQSGTHTATMTKFLFDGISGGDNFSTEGFPGADSDIYQNRITHTFDDAIESEGGNRNVRIWGNYMDWIFSPIGNACVSVGPIYVWRNISNIVGGTRVGFDPDTEGRQPFVKGGGKGSGGGVNGGRAYYFQNTALQPSIGETQKGGVGWGIANWAGDSSLYNFVSRNNIWQNHRADGGGAAIDANPASSVAANFNPALHETDRIDHDLVNENNPFQPSTIGNPNATGIPGTPSYSADFMSPSTANGYTGIFTLASTSPGRGQAAAINNFNAGTGSDVGAHQSGTPPMKFGVAAAGTGPTAHLNTTPSPATGQGSLAVTFTSSSTPGSAPISNLHLDFGDTSTPIDWTDQAVSQSHTYSAGNFTATLTVTDANNRTANTSVPVNVTAPSCVAPTARLSAAPTTGDAPLTVNFDATASTAVSPATITSYSITYADGASGTGATQSHTYQSAGNFTAALVVRDSNGCDSAPATQTISVVTPPPPPPPPGGPTTVTLMQGQNNYAGASDVWISDNSPNTPQSGDLALRLESRDAIVMRFAIFAREGGPVPDNAVINSATLSLYKFNGPDTVIKASRLLKSFNELEATWNVAAIGAPWTTAGALGAGSDYLATADGQASIGDATGCTTAPFPDTCWLNINVTAGVQAFAGGASNLGWKLAEVSSSLPGSYKNFNSKENNFFPALRPKLTVSYTIPTSVTLMQGQNNYAGASDVWISDNSPNTPQSGDLALRLESRDAIVMRFAIFAREGGPVPDNAVVHSATLSLYKFNGPDTVIKASRLLKSFNGSEATWSVAAIGAPWTTAGALSAGSDYLATADGQASIGDATGCTTAPFPDTCWLNINVTAGVQAFAGGASNLGWKLAEVSSSLPGSYKNFNSKENNFFPALRPKLTVSYTIPTSVTLMQGQDNYAGASDVWINAASPNSPQSGDLALRRESTDAIVMRFAIFAHEGGPVPDNAIVHSATLSLYKFNGPDSVIKASRLLKSFSEAQATWNVAATGTSWNTAGALSAGSDYLATADGQTAIGDATGCTSAPFPDTCWLNINVTSGVQAFAAGASNFGWKLAEVSSSLPGNYKNFNSKENNFFPALRPKLTVTYTP